MTRWANPSLRLVCVVSVAALLVLLGAATASADPGAVPPPDATAPGPLEPDGANSAALNAQIESFEQPGSSRNSRSRPRLKRSTRKSRRTTPQRHPARSRQRSPTRTTLKLTSSMPSRTRCRARSPRCTARASSSTPNAGRRQLLTQEEAALEALESMSTEDLAAAQQPAGGDVSSPADDVGDVVAAADDGGAYRRTGGRRGSGAGLVTLWHPGFADVEGSPRLVAQPVTTSTTGDAGEHGVGLLVTQKLTWHFRPQKPADVGIDGRSSRCLVVGRVIGSSGCRLSPGRVRSRREEGWRRLGVPGELPHPPMIWSDRSGRHKDHLEAELTTPTGAGRTVLRGMSGRCVRKGGWLSYVAPFRRDRGAAGF